MKRSAADSVYEHVATSGTNHNDNRKKARRGDIQQDERSMSPMMTTAADDSNMSMMDEDEDQSPDPVPGPSSSSAGNASATDGGQPQKAKATRGSR